MSDYVSRPRATCPAECLELGFAGYAKAWGGVKPSETTWYRHIAERLQSVGCMIWQNQAGPTTNGIPDKICITPVRPIWLEFKICLHDNYIRENQVAAMRALNGRTFYGSGTLCCFVIMQPDLIGVCTGRRTVREICRIDALSHPAAFVYALDTICAHAVRFGMSGQQTADIAKKYNVDFDPSVFPLKQYDVRNRDGSHRCFVQAFSPGLAIKQTTGQSYSDTFAMFGQNGLCAVEVTGVDTIGLPL